MLTDSDLQRIAEPHATISDKVRALAAAEVPKARIARFLGRHPTQVRNVLRYDASRKPAREPQALDVAANAPSVRIEHPAFYRVVRLGLEPDGSLRLPPEMVRRLGLADGDQVVAECIDDRATLMSEASALARSEALAAHRLPERERKALGSDEIIAARRDEVEIEEAKYQAERLRWSS